MTATWGVVGGVGRERRLDGLDGAGHERRRSHRWLSTQPVEHASRQDEGIVRARDGRMAGFAADGDLEAMEALLRRLDRIEPSATDLDADAAGLGQAGVGAKQVGFVVDDERYR